MVIELPLTMTVVTDGGPVSLVFDIARPEEAEELAEFFIGHFVTTPPFRQIYFWEDSEKNRRPDFSLEVMTKCLKQPVSLIVREQTTGQLVAFQTNLIEDRQSFLPYKTPQDKKTDWLHRALLAEMYQGVDLYDLYDTERIMEFYMNAVHPDYRKLGIGHKMDEISYEIARSQMPIVGAVKIEAFSHYAGRNPAFDLIKNVDYAMFEVHGNRPLAVVDMGEHKSARLLARPVIKVA